MAAVLAASKAAEAERIWRTARGLKKPKDAKPNALGRGGSRRGESVSISADHSNASSAAAYGVWTLLQSQCTKCS